MIHPVSRDEGFVPCYWRDAMQCSERLRRAALWLCLLPFGMGCGGSSSETPPPLRPHALHEAYRSPRVVAPKPSASSNAEPVEVESDDAPPPNPGGASRTWGSSAPPALPETEIK